MSKPPPPRENFRHARRLPRRHVLRAIACVTAAVVLFTGAGAVALYGELMGNVSKDYAVDDFRTATPTPSPSASETTPPDPHAGQPYNILLMGTDSRDGDNFDGTDITGARADTTILVHIPADRSRIEAISIPRDTLVDIPSCPMSADGSRSSYEQYWEEQTMFNAAFATGAWEGDVGLGALCTLLTVENMTGLTIDDYAVVDFSGFKRMVDAIGGVPMCVPERLYSEEAVIDLQPGFQTLDGTQALGYARLRKGRGDGSDWNRIDHQQELLAAIVRQVMSKNLVTNSYQLIQFLDAVTSSLTVSQGLSNPLQLTGLASAIAPVGAAGVTFVTMPFEQYSENENRVVQTDVTQLMWERLRNDVPINSATPDPGDAGATTPAPGASTPAQPATPADPTTDATPEPAPSDPWDIKTGLTEPAC